PAASRPAPAAAPPVGTREPAPPAAEASASTAAASGDLAELNDWRALVGRIKVGGMARMLAENCEFRGAEGDNVALAVPEAHKHLLEKAYTDKLQAALGDYFGRKLRLKIAAGGSGNTPAEMASMERRKRLDQAIEAIDSDPFVRELVENFDARVNESTIKPVQ
ncbi:MAG TPA: DNA polymerase III subunit gamma/tau C-terminal domain-containing protein, partial [Burkholderiales bacterium]|nr:DNA polymerase III subunit gamma/tau C-terminal domain-containing protein [Burkholderiales bacterium]